MKKYSSLIRKLVDSVAEAESRNEDVADVLKNRCFNDTDIVRQTLMNAVCDPRFKLKASIVGYWRDEARNALTQLAEQLEMMEEKTEENAYYMLDGFLNAWLRKTFDGYSKSSNITSLLKPVIGQEEEWNVDDALDLLNALEEELEDVEEADDDEDVDEDNPSENDEGNKKKTDKESKKGAKLLKKKNGKSSELARRKISGVGMMPANSINIQQIEESFLERIPLSLVRLARMIGRMGGNGFYKNGRFLTAGKSDIAGITTGNDISAIVPSELSLLSEPKTQDVFYRNFTARRLQLFASASQSKAPRRRHDGPVIICVDTSSSMGGEPMKVARALAVAVAIVAWRQERDVVVVKYSDDYDYLDLGHNHKKLSELSHYLTHVSQAGNDENRMFQWLFRDMKPFHTDYESADILCISDFGWTSLDKQTVGIIDEEKQKGMFFYGLNVNSDNPTVPSLPVPFETRALSDDSCQSAGAMDVCDSVWVYDKGECREIKKASKKK